MKTSDVVKQPNSFTAYVLDVRSRTDLRQIFPPKYDFVGHHVTETFKADAPETYPLGSKVKLSVVGYIDDDGIEVLVCSVDGSTQRPDGGIYHVTWSLDKARGKKPGHSNDAIKKGPVADVKPAQFQATYQRIPF